MEGVIIIIFLIGIVIFLGKSLYRVAPKCPQCGAILERSTRYKGSRIQFDGLICPKCNFETENFKILWP